MGATGTEEDLEEISSSPADVFAVVTDLNLARVWGETQNGQMIFPPESTMKLGQIVDLRPKNCNYPCRFKVRLIRYQERIDMELIEGPFFGMLSFLFQPRPYGTLLETKFDYRIERVGFRMKWSVSEKKKFRALMESILAQIKNLAEMRAKA